MSFKVQSVSQRPNLRHLCELLVETEGLLEAVGFLEDDGKYVMKNKRKYQKAVSSRLKEQRY